MLLIRVTRAAFTMEKADGVVRLTRCGPRGMRAWGHRVPSGEFVGVLVSPGFDGSGNSLSARIIQPMKFFGVYFGTSTDVQAPSISANGSSHLSGDPWAWASSCNNQEFNQASPKPGGSHPGLTTTNRTGTYDAFTLNWASSIVGGPFNNFAGSGGTMDASLASTGLAPCCWPAWSPMTPTGSQP